MLFVIRFVASVAITLWGIAMILLGAVHRFPLWIAIGLAVSAVGLPLLASHPWATRILYPTAGNIEGADPPEPTPPPPA